MKHAGKELGGLKRRKCRNFGEQEIAYTGVVIGKQAEMQNVMITLPEGYVVEEAPKPIIIKLDGATARIVCNVNGNVLNVQYVMNIDKTFFASTQYQDLKAFFDKLVESNKHIITVKKQQF